MMNLSKFRWILKEQFNFFNKITIKLSEFARPPILECGPLKKAYDLGAKKNFKQVFGNEVWKWPLPIPSRFVVFEFKTFFVFCFKLWHWI